MFDRFVEQASLAKNREKKKKKRKRNMQNERWNIRFDGLVKSFILHAPVEAYTCLPYFFFFFFCFFFSLFDTFSLCQCERTHRVTSALIIYK